MYSRSVFVALRVFLFIAIYGLVSGVGVDADTANVAPAGLAAGIAVTQAAQMPKSGDPRLDQMILDAGTKYGVDPKLIHHVIRQESGFKAQAKSHKNAQGLMQLIPATAERFGVRNPYDPRQNIEGGVRYLRWLLKEFDGNLELALAGYNAGEGAVRKYGNRVPRYKETKVYVRNITAAYGKKRHPVLPPEQARARFGLADAVARRSLAR